MTSFSFFKCFDAFELDVNVVNFVYYGKTRMSMIVPLVKATLGSFRTYLLEILFSQLQAISMNQPLLPASIGQLRIDFCQID